MILRKQSLAMCISLALMGTLTACSGSSNQSTPVKSLTPATPAVQTPASNSENSSQANSGSTSKSEDVPQQNENTAQSSENASAHNENTAQNSENAPAHNESTAQNSENASTHNESTAPNSEDSTSSGDNSAQNTENEVAETPEAKRAKLETSLDPEGKIRWRQMVSIIPASETAVNNPLGENSNGKISPQQGAAAYANGAANYQDGNTVKDFRNAAHRATTDYDPSFMTTAEIDPNRLQLQAIKNKNGTVVANQHFVNQTYSSYTSWKSEETPIIGGEPMNDRMAGYLAVPTKTEVAQNKGKATYRGHTLVQAADNSGLHFGDIELNADFDALKVKGKLTNRNDTLLDSAVKRYFDEPDVTETYTTNEEDLEDDPALILISEEEMAQKEAEFQQKLQAAQAKFHKVDVAINPLNMKTENNVISFFGLNALSYTDGENTRTTGIMGGIFAGDNAQEVVGEIQGNSQFMSFGAVEVEPQP